jgi:hypothetical protein
VNFPRCAIANADGLFWTAAASTLAPDGAQHMTPAANHKRRIGWLPATRCALRRQRSDPSRFARGILNGREYHEEPDNKPSIEKSFHEIRKNIAAMYLPTH